MKAPSLMIAFSMLVTSALAAENILFEDTFGQALAAGPESRGDFNVGMEQRQIGPLAPVAYTHNGQGWQAQTQFNHREGVLCRLFPVQPWLAASPEWELDSADGTHEVVFEFSHPTAQTPHLGEDELQRPPAPPAETILIIGQSVPAEGIPLRLHEGFGVVHRTNPDAPSLLWIRGQPWGEFEPSQTGETRHTIKLRWTQKGGIVSGIEGELNGQILQDDGGFSLAEPRILFGARGRFTPSDHEVGRINCLNVLLLSYSKK